MDGSEVQKIEDFGDLWPFTRLVLLSLAARRGRA